jgi:hypothetical protein
MLGNLRAANVDLRQDEPARRLALIEVKGSPPLGHMRYPVRP